MTNLLHGQDILSTKQFSRDELDLILETAEQYNRKLESGEKLTPMDNQVLATLFFEPSTRTRLSFETAMHKLGGDVVTIADPKTSSAAKGESMADSIRTVEGYADLIVIRHPEVGSAEEAAEAASLPILNAGDGAGQHPTQALLDIYTVKHEEGKLEDLTVTLVGDLKNGRTVHSLVYLLAQYEGVKLNFVAPEQLSLPRDIVKELGEVGTDVSEYTRMGEPLKETDVVYMTRIQEERFEDRQEYEELKGVYVLDKEKIEAAKEGLTIMHPLPRVNEIPSDVDDYEGAAYFRQAANGVPIRMALLALVSGRVN
ncbi:aspartate carbamoyltransferase [Candidatus Bipolaricaulota bacterium]|nr:aspartate carbamoyltransferase [Candidatus Bipolaricaulota bacterium]